MLPVVSARPLALAATKKGGATKGGHLFLPVEGGDVKLTLDDGRLTLTTDAAEPTHQRKKLKPLDHDGGELWIFPAALTVKQLRREKKGALHVPDQRSPGGAWVEVSAKKLTANVSEGFVELTW